VDTAGQPVSSPAGQQAQKAVPQAANPWVLPPKEVRPHWALHQPLDLHIYLSTTPDGNVFTHPEDDLPHFTWGNINYGDWTESRTVEYEVTFPKVSRSVIRDELLLHLLTERFRVYSIMALFGPIYL
jgi:Cleft lip and palate transmembrane protein 1 (CLPTM1)